MPEPFPEKIRQMVRKLINSIGLVILSIMRAVKFSTRKATDSYSSIILAMIEVQNLVNIEITEDSTNYLYHFR